jgi:DNA replication protein DnaC
MGLKNFQYNKIHHEYDNRQLHNKFLLDKRINEVYQKIPALKEIDDSIATTSVAHAKLALLGNPVSINDLISHNMELSMKKVELLCENGYPRDYLSPLYFCNDCKDTGYINGEKCHCFKQAIVNLLYSQSNIKSVIQRENFETFSYNYYPDDYVDKATSSTPLDNIKKVVGACKGFIKTFDSTYNNILLYGNTGVGKTFIANCIAKELLDSSHTVIYLTAFQLFDILEKNKFNKKADNYTVEDQFNYILNCNLLIIDDLGTELNNSFISSQLYLCINERHLNQNSTIISTNLSFDDLSTHYSERIFSRITSNYMLLKIVGEDIRLKKAIGT